MPARGETAAASRQRGRWITAGFATIAVLAVIIWFTRPERITQVTIALGWSGAAVITALYAIIQLLRTLRVWCALPTPARPAFWQIFGIVAIHQCLNHLLPLRLGEAGFPLLMKRYAAVSMAAATSLLLVIRLQELVVLSVGFGAALLLRLVDSVGNVPAGGLLLAPLGGITALFLLFRYIPALLQISARLLRKWHFPTALVPRTERLARFVDRLHGEWTAPAPAARRLVGWGITFAIWFGTCFLCMQGLRFSGFDISLTDTVLGSTIASLSHVLPINAFGSFGSLEVGWTFGFAILGFEPRGVLAVAFVLHVLLMIFLVVSAAIAWASLPAIPLRRRPTDADS